MEEMTQDLFDLKMALIEENLCPECQHELEGLEVYPLEPDGVDNREREERSYYCHGCHNGFVVVVCYDDMTASFYQKECTYEEILEFCGLDEPGQETPGAGLPSGA